MGHDHTGMLPIWLKAGSAIILSLLIFNGYIQKYLTTKRIRSQSINPSGFAIENIKTIQVGGMTCNHCKANVENSIKSSEGVKDAAVDLISGKVIIKGTSFDLEKIKSGIESIGYRIIKE